MTRILVAGYGSSLRRDDAAGRHVVRAVAERWGQRVTVLIDHQPLPEWAAALAQADVAFFVDATLEAGRSVRLQDVLPVPLGDSHGFRPEQLIWLTQSVYGRMPAAYLVSIPAHDVEFGEELSNETAQAVRQAVDMLGARIAALRPATLESRRTLAAANRRRLER